MSKLPPGLYDLPLTEGLKREIDARLGERIGAATEPLDPADGDLLLGRHLAAIVRQALRNVPTAERPVRQVEIINELLSALRQSNPAFGSDDDRVVSPASRLASIHAIDPLAGPQRLAEPLIPVSQSDLLVNARGEPSVSESLKHEIESADRIDLLCAFIKWSGLRLISGQLEEFINRGGKLRVITTTYIGATQRKAVDRLVEMGAEVRISYLDRATRLHAKAWLFYRNSGFSTAYIGSSNLSTSALIDGLEWNVRLSRTDAPTILEKFEATFDSYWADPDFESYDPATHHDKFDRAIWSASQDTGPDLTLFDLHPHAYQEEILEKLTVERYRHNRWKNLVVAATGTGKTVIAAFDYRRLSEELNDGRPLRLLFVAHRREILKQSLTTFRHVMRDGALGELYVDGRRPEEWQQVFASVQSLQNLDFAETPPDIFDVIIIDEFHHAAAPTYETILDHFRPRVLLGLTATPERMDGRSILGWFDGRTAAELRLWDALDRGFLVPFHYFGIGDEIDLSTVKWTRGRYDARELENLYTADDARVRLILRELNEKLTSISEMRALGFCVGIDHARMMARRFEEAGIPSRAILGETDRDERDQALRDLKHRKINCVFAVDIFNEGVDVPEIDTVLFLRPTESATIFLQQLGRGLRRTRDKDCLTVLDFIGNANRNFRFDRRYRAILGGTRKEVEDAVREDFPFLPPGCSIRLDRIARDHVLRNLKDSLGSGIRGLVEELRSIGEPVTLSQFLDRTGTDLEDIYHRAKGSWTRIQRESGIYSTADPHLRIADGNNNLSPSDDPGRARRLPSQTAESDISESVLLRGLHRIIHMDESRRLSFLREFLQGPTLSDASTLPPLEHRILTGFLNTLIAAKPDLAEGIAALQIHDAIRAEILQLLDVLEDRAGHETIPIQESPSLVQRYSADIPLSLHARYTRAEFLAAIAYQQTQREGPLWHEPSNTDYFFITLEKSEKHYSPSTRYKDYAIAPDIFHWESQSGTHDGTETGQRYIHHDSRGSHVMLLVRSTNKVAARSQPFTLLGPASYVSHTGAKPMAILWRLHHPMPLDIFRIAKVAGG